VLAWAARWQNLHRHRRRGDEGASLVEYALLVALVALVSVGALLYLGNSSAGAVHKAAQVAVGFSGPEPSGHDWCTSANRGCSDAIDVTGQQVIHLSAGGGKSPYTFYLRGAPSFVSLPEPGAGTGERDVYVHPTTCAQVGTYGGITVAVTDSASPQGRGELTFTLTVGPGSSC